MNAADEIIVRESLAERIANSVSSVITRVLLAPIYFDGREDYLSTHYEGEPEEPESRHAVDLTHIGFAAIYLKSFSDDPDSSPHSPLTTYEYEVYLFCEYDAMRADENANPDAYKKMMLERHNSFTEAIIGLKQEFQGEIVIADLDSSYSYKRSLPLTLREDVQNRIECEFIPGVRGHSIRVGIRVRLQKEDC